MIIGLKKNIAQWMVIYTRSNFEKKVDKNLKEQGIVSYCPLITSRNKWADRVKTVEKPFFSSYLFVKASPLEVNKIKSSPGVITLLSHNGKHVVITELEIEQIRSITQNYADAEVISLKSLKIGDKVKITDGLLVNKEGLVNKIMGTKVLMVIEQLDCAVVVKVNQLALNVAS
ncbi:Transcription antitermination factor NusG [Mucilaginibacter mallensis]|uniref:Transcription antitermination factor NusG n=1 Tax=Mucilaginibacter mallensis TaxID=652787 RepID=A0A1H1X7I9_MUCMA|nr:UpxY family transcription antiterminator [Mucilaginibacter mallensis]SDT05295.1 Transcription antitermination factor NusG [Mucilaginibacter mallensis]